MPALLGVSTFFLHQTSFCQLPGSGDAGQWTSGPAQASLGDQALLTIPANYKFAAPPAAQAAAAVAKLGKLPGLLGFMTSESGDGWKVAFQFEKLGYVSAEAAPKFDKNAILKTLQRQNQTGSISWVLEPTYDVAAHRLQYAVSIQTADQKATEYVAQILGKEGVVRAIVLSRGVAAVDDFRQVTQVTFKPGMAYEDFRAGAQRAQLTLSQLPTLQPPSFAGSDLAAAPKSTLLARIGFGAGLLVVIVCGVLILMRVWRKTTPAAQPMVPAASPAQTRPSLIAAAALAAAPAPPAAAAPELPATDHNTPLPAPAALRPKLGPTPMPNRNNNNRRPLRTFTSHFNRRRKEFDYNRYFADLMATVSGSAAAVQSASAGYALKLTHLTNGAATGGPPAFASANSELIANQTTLIEEQRRLIQEQTRLIEEKAKLIAEKNQLLKLQAQMLEGKEL